MAPGPPIPPSRVTLGEALRYRLRPGLISFGGQIPMMQKELGEKRRWIRERRFLLALNCCKLPPGPQAIRLTIYRAG